MGPIAIGSTEDLVVALFLCALERTGEGRDCLPVPHNVNNVDWMYSLSDNRVNDDDGSFVLRAGDADEGHLLLLVGWRINLIACSRWANRTMRNHACRQAVEPSTARLVAAAGGTKTT